MCVCVCVCVFAYLWLYIYKCGCAVEFQTCRTATVTGAIHLNYRRARACGNGILISFDDAFHRLFGMLKMFCLTDK